MGRYVMVFPSLLPEPLHLSLLSRFSSMVFSILFSYKPNRCFSVLFLYTCLLLSSDLLVSIYLFPLFPLPSDLISVSDQSFLASTIDLVPDSPLVFLVVCHTFLVILPMSNESCLLIHKGNLLRLSLCSHDLRSHLPSQLFYRSIFLEKIV